MTRNELLVYGMLAQIGRTQRDIERQGYTTEDQGVYNDAGYFCTASWHVMDGTNIYGECPNCCEPVVRVWVR